MKLMRQALAGSLESSDVQVNVAPSESTTIEIQSIVAAQFEDAILKTVEDVLKEFNVTAAAVRLEDRGALDCTIRARVETALLRAAKEG